MIYLDYNAITNGFEDILKETLSLSLEYKFLNPSSTHEAGKNAKNILENAKMEITSSLKAKCHDIYFVSGATEGNNMVLNCRDFEKIFTLKTEHDSILSPLKNKPHSFIAVDENGLVNLNSLEEEIKALQSSNFLCSIMFANNESGIIQDIKQIGDLVKSYGGVMHSDCSQVMGKFHFDFTQFNLDVITLSGNKIHSGLGGGVVIFESGFECKPLIFGGGQQNYKRGGTENIPQIFALSKALKKVNSKEYLEEYQNKTSHFKELIEKTVIQNNGEVFGFNAKRLSNTSLIKMQNVNNFIQMMEFDLNDICISIGSACSSGRTFTSHVLTACGILEEEAKKYIRISSGIFNTTPEVEKFCEIWQGLSKR